MELFAAMAVGTVLTALLLPVLDQAHLQALSADSAENLHTLAEANLLYVADHNGQFCPAQDPSNLHRWHGARASIGAPFDPTKGYLSPYLGDAGQGRICPVFVTWPQSSESFEKGAGSYGYNAAYIGGTPGNPFTPEFYARVVNPSRTIMFTDTAFPRGDGLQEYPFCEPFAVVNSDGSVSGAMQPSVHFRHSGMAHVAWCDGAVTSEPPSRLGGPNGIYGGDGQQALIGWLGPAGDNGYWNAEHDPGP